MKQAQQPQPEPEPTREQLEAEFRADDVELCKAATTIQNSFRNHLKTKEGAGKEGEGSAGGKEENKVTPVTAFGMFEMCRHSGIGLGRPEIETDRRQNSPWEEELDIDLTDPDLNKAATKIQASFRGHKVRKETDPVPEAPAKQ